MAGHVLREALVSEGHQVIGTSRYAKHFQDSEILRFDALELDSWIPFFRSIRVDFVVNCIGVLVEASDRDPAKALTINTLLPKFLESFYSNSKTRVIHISTDCVFDGKKGKYHPKDTPTEKKTYGFTKALGEISNQKDLTIRTSIIGLELGDKPNSSENSGLLHWFLSRPQGSTIKGFTNCFWSGISTLELADAVSWYIWHMSRNPLASGLFGIHQISRPCSISKFELLQIASSVFGHHLEIVPCSAHKIDKSMLSSPEAFQVNAGYRDMLMRIARTRELNAG
tara:strand:+ start:441 stop:1289 length:849 start_codon:yes stop_codon:yes gene_type:complete